MTFGSGPLEAGPDHRIAGIRPCWFNEFGGLTSSQPRFCLLCLLSDHQIREEQASSAPLAVFKQYREADGKFYFKLVEGERVLLQSIGFDSPKDAGARVGVLKRGAFDEADADVMIGDGVTPEDVHAALAALLAAEAAKA